MALNILIVDDSTTVRAIIRKTLEIAGVPAGEVHNASNGQEALSVLEKQWIDLVFTDINMPVMSGLELVDRMLADEKMRTIPVVVVSTDGSAQRIAQLQAKGVRAYVRKPFTPEQIRSIVKEAVGV